MLVCDIDSSVAALFSHPFNQLSVFKAYLYADIYIHWNKQEKWLTGAYEK